MAALVATLAELKAQLNITVDDTDHDTELTTYLGAASGTVADYVGPLAPAAFTETCKVSETGVIAVRHRPLTEVTSVAVQGSPALPTTAYTVDTETASIQLAAPPTAYAGSYAAAGWSLPPSRYTVAYTAGWQTVPERAKLAGLIIAQHLWETQRGAAGTARGLVIGADETYDPRYSYAIPRRALELLGARLPGLA